MGFIIWIGIGFILLLLVGSFLGFLEAIIGRKNMGRLFGIISYIGVLASVFIVIMEIKYGLLLYNSFTDSSIFTALIIIPVYIAFYLHENSNVFFNLHKNMEDDYLLVSILTVFVVGYVNLIYFNETDNYIKIEKYKEEVGKNAELSQVFNKELEKSLKDNKISPYEFRKLEKIVNYPEKLKKEQNKLEQEKKERLIALANQLVKMEELSTGKKTGVVLFKSIKVNQTDVDMYFVFDKGHLVTKEHELKAHIVRSSCDTSKLYRQYLNSGGKINYIIQTNKLTTFPITLKDCK